MTGRAPGFFLACIVVTGCAHWDVGDPTPGIVDVSTPPEVAGRRHVIPAEEAGEKMLMVNSGIFGSTGVRAGQSGLDLWSTWGGEVSVHWGESRNNHADTFPAHPFEPVFPTKSWALTVGGSPRSVVRSSSTSGGSDLYLEVQRMWELYGLAAGPVWNRMAGLVGGQVTAFLGHIYARATVLDRDAALQVGITVKFPLTLVWPR